MSTSTENASSEKLLNLVLCMYEKATMGDALDALAEDIDVLWMATHSDGCTPDALSRPLLRLQYRVKAIQEIYRLEQQESRQAAGRTNVVPFRAEPGPFAGGPTS